MRYFPAVKSSQCVNPGYKLPVRSAVQPFLRSCHVQTSKLKWTIEHEHAFYVDLGMLVSIHSHENDIENLVYIFEGDFSKSDDVDYLLNPQRAIDDYKEMINDNVTGEELYPELFEEFDHVWGNSPEVKEIKRLTYSVQNLTRRYGRFVGFTDPWEWGWHWDIEQYKRIMLNNLILQFLIHARYKLYAALNQRLPIRHDKRYRLGYLFNRLRRIHYDQNKILSTAAAHTWRSLKKELVLMTKQIRLYRDLKDTIAMIERIGKEPDPMQLLQEKSKADAEQKAKDLADGKITTMLPGLGQEGQESQQDKMAKMEHYFDDDDDDDDGR